MENKKLPIGYWVKQVDQLLTTGIDEVQAEFGLTRSDWQILNALAEESSIEKNKLLNLMNPFLDRGKTEETIKNLCNKDLISMLDNFLSLTEKGKKQHSSCFEKQKKFRQSAMKDIAEEDYEKTIQTLQKIIGNLKK